MMSLEFFILFVIIGFVLGVGLVVAIARSLNPGYNYGPHQGFETRDSGIGSWMLLLILLFVGYFMLQSKCGRDFREKISDFGSRKELKDWAPPKSESGLFEKNDPPVEKFNSTAKTVDLPFSNEASEIDLEDRPISRDFSEPLDEASTDDYSQNTAHPSCYLQVSAFYSYETAQTEMDIWADMIGRPTYLGIIHGESPATFRVLIGPFDSIGKAKSFRDCHNLDGFVQMEQDLMLL